MTQQGSREFKSALESAISSFGLDPLAEGQASQLVRHYELLCRWNERVNLTRIIRPAEAARLHYAESIFGARFIGDARTVLDIGSGAGFPAIPLAVVRPDIEVTALEANQKKSLFLKEARDAMRLANLKVVTARLEDLDWSGYELLTSRALERAKLVFKLVIERMSAHQRLMLFCARDLVVELTQDLAAGPEVAIHPVPLSESRMIAIISRSLK